MPTRTDVGLHAVEVLGAAIFGVLIADPDLIVWSIAPAVVVIVALGFQYATASKRWQRDVHAALKSALDLAPLEGRVRATYHVPIRKGAKYRQAVEYVPSGGGRGRRFPSSEGVVGKCIADKGLNQCVANFKTESEFKSKMTTEFGYEIESMERRTQNRLSCLALPVKDDRHHLIGVIYMDSDQDKAFPPKGSVEVMRMLDRLADDLGVLGR